MHVIIDLHIKENRIKNNVSLRKLEKLSGVSRGYLSLVENGECMPTLLTICKIAKGLKVPVTDLFDYK